MSIQSSDVKLVLIGGGSYDWAYRFITDIACIEQLHGMHIVLHDIDAEALQLVKTLCEKSTSCWVQTCTSKPIPAWNTACPALILSD